MSAELIMSVVGAILGIATIVIALWQVLRAEKSLPKKIEVTYATLRVLFFASDNSLPTANTGLKYDQLYRQVVDDCNANTSGGNFKKKRKNKTLDSYTKESIRRLNHPESNALGPLIEVRGEFHTVTPLGSDMFNKLPSNRSDGADLLDNRLKGLGPDSSKPSAVANRTTAASAPTRRPNTPKEWRYAVFMAMPEDRAYELNDLKQQIGRKLSLSSLRRSAYDNVEQAIAWNLGEEQGNFVLEADGRVRLAVPKTDKELKDFD